MRYCSRGSLASGFVGILVIMKQCIECGKAKSSKGVYCKSCSYKHRTRPSGLKYKIVKENPTSFKKGSIPWNKGLVGVMPIPWNKGLKCCANLMKGV